MVYNFLKVDFKLVDDEYRIQQVEVIGKFSMLNTFNFNHFIGFGAKCDTTFYVNDLDKFYIYLIKELFDEEYKNTTEELTHGTFTYAYKNGKCANVKIITFKGIHINFVNFKAKFGVEWGADEQNAELLAYALENRRRACSLGADAYNEFVRTVLHPNKYNEFIAHEIMRQEDHFPIFEYGDDLLEAKQHCAGYQYCKRGSYENLIEYDISSSYPAQLLCDTPKGYPKHFKRLEDVPRTYFKVITFTYFDCVLKPNKIDFIQTSSMGQLSLTEQLFELFKENYNAKIKIKHVTAFKTQKSPFRKFITANIINGKQLEKRKHIAQYNKYIGNSIIGYMGRNTTQIENTAKLSDLGIVTGSVEKTINPMYLPVYLSVLDKAKTAFVRTVQKHQNKIVYANTDGFLSTEPINTYFLNAKNSLPIGNYRQKSVYAKIFIECMNGYSGIKDTGEVDNTIAGMRFEDLITPEQYEQRQFTYYVNTPTPHGTIRKQAVTPHQ